MKDAKNKAKLAMKILKSKPKTDLIFLIFFTFTRIQNIDKCFIMGTMDNYTIELPCKLNVSQ